MSSPAAGQPPPGTPTLRYSTFQVAMPASVERVAHVAGVDQVVGRLPVAAVEHDRERRARAAGETQVAELERLGAVGEALVRRRRRRVGEDVLAVAAHDATFQARITGCSRS